MASSVMSLNLGAPEKFGMKLNKQRSRQAVVDYGPDVESIELELSDSGA